MLTLSGAGTGAKPAAVSNPARLSTSGSNASPRTVRPRKSGPNRSKACSLGSTMVTLYPWCEMDKASSTPTRPQPTITMCSAVFVFSMDALNLFLAYVIRHFGNNNILESQQAELQKQGGLHVQ